MEDRLTKWLTPAGAVAFILALTALRVGALIAARTDLGFEEAQYWSWSRELDFGFYSKPPLLALVIRLTTALFGDGEAAVRLASPILHAASALVIMALAWRAADHMLGALRRRDL